jgi:hypothetical protein
LPRSCFTSPLPFCWTPPIKQALVECRCNNENKHLPQAVCTVTPTSLIRPRNASTLCLPHVKSFPWSLAHSIRHHVRAILHHACSVLLSKANRKALHIFLPALLLHQVSMPACAPKPCPRQRRETATVGSKHPLVEAYNTMPYECTDNLKSSLAAASEGHQPLGEPEWTN